MLHSGNYMPVPFAQSTFGFSVTFPVIPYQNTDVTEFSGEKKSVCSYSGKTNGSACEKCRLEKIESLNRQLYKLVKEHGHVEVTGKEILAWFILLADEDRRLIKEYGHISEYIKKNPSLLIVNNWVQLKSESTEILERPSEMYFSSMENSQQLEDTYNPSYSLDYSDRMLQSSRPADLNPQSDTFWLRGDNDSQKEYLDPGNKSFSACNAKSLHLEKRGTAKTREPAKTFDSEDIERSLTPVPLDLQNHQETAQDFAYFTSRLQSLTKESFAKKQCVNESKEVNTESAECDFSCHTKLKTGNNCLHRKFALSKGYENFQESDRVVAPDERSPVPWCKYFSDVADNPVDTDCSSVDVLEDETFFSVKSGSFYSRSSSPLTLDDSTDVEQCDFEEALEDISSFSLYKQSPNSQIVPDADVQSLVWDSFLDIKNRKCTANEQKGFVEKETIYSKSKQRNVLCNTDLSLVSVSYIDKETQTKTRSTQDTGVNTDPFGLFSQIQATTPGVEITNNMQESKGTRGFSSLSPEALLQRAVKAELQLVDVQRWLCWQMCWKTQQQTLEKQYYFNLNKDSSKQSEPLKSFSLSSALAEVEEKYQEMRTKIQSGTPLDTLVPLSMQLTTVDTSADYLLKDACQPSERQNVPDVPAEGLKGADFRKNDLEPSLTFCLDKYEQKPNEHSTENLSEPNCFYVHVGNVAPCVKEAELMDVFQKYHVLSVFLEESSLSCSYAVLIFCKSDEAGAAIKEMDGKMLHGKKLKVRAIKTSSHNLPLAFQKIKSVSEDITKDEKGTLHTVKPKEGFVTEPLKNVFTQPSQVQHGPTHAPPVGANLKNDFVNMPSNKYCPPINTNQGFPAAPYCNVSGFSNFMAPGYQWMCQSPHSNMLPYSNMPNLMYVPFSYPLYKLPAHPPFQSSVTNSNTCIPGNTTKPNVNSHLFKENKYSVRGKHAKSMHSTDRQSNFGISRSTVQKQTISLTDKTKVLERDTGAKLLEDKPATEKSVNEQTSLTTSSNGNLHCSVTSCPDDSLKMSVPVTTAGIHGVGMTGTDCLSSGYTEENSSDPSSLRSTAPLRFPICVPPSVTIPEASKPSVNLGSSTGVLAPFPQQADVSSSVVLQQGDSLSAGNLSLLMKQPSQTSSLGGQYGSRVPCKPQDWGVYPKLDPSSELPVVIIPNQLNFSQFKRVVKYLMEHHEDATRDQIIKTLDEIRKSRGGTFGGWTIPEIIFAVSSKLVGNTPPT